MHSILTQSRSSYRPTKAHAKIYSLSIGLDPLTELVARTIINIAQTGERNSDRIRELALQDLRENRVPLVGR